MRVCAPVHLVHLPHPLKKRTYPPPGLPAQHAGAGFPDGYYDVAEVGSRMRGHCLGNTTAWVEEQWPESIHILRCCLRPSTRFKIPQGVMYFGSKG